MYLVCIDECGWVKHTTEEDDEDQLGCPECAAGVLCWSDSYWRDAIAPHGAGGMVVGGTHELDTTEFPPDAVTG